MTLSTRDFPPTLVRDKRLKCFVYNANGRNLLNDGLSLFRCLSVFLFKTDARACTNNARKLREKYCNWIGIETQNLKTISIADIKNIERCFKTGIRLYESKNNTPSRYLHIQRHEFNGKSPFHNLPKNKIMNVYFHQKQHFCLITELKSLVGFYKCKTCYTLYPKKKFLTQHRKNCVGLQTTIVKSGEFHLREKNFEILQKLGINVPDPHRLNSIYFACVDIETKPTQLKSNFNTAKMTFCYRHDPIVISVATNIPEERSRLFVCNDSKNLEGVVRNFTKYLEQLRKKVIHLNFVRLKPIFGQLYGLKERVKNAGKTQRYHYVRIKNTIRHFAKYYSCLNILGFNSRSYDWRILSPVLFPILQQEYGGIRFMIKRQGRYDFFTTPGFRFGDVMNYLGQFCSLKDFCKSYGGKIPKKVFPFKLLKKGLKALKNMGMPKKKYFYSDLSGKSLLGDTEKTIDENYKKFTKQYKGNKCKNLYEWLLIYSDTDTKAMVKPIENMLQVYFEHNVDLLSSHPTIQSAVLPILMKFAPPNSNYIVPDKNTYQILRKSIRGGLSCIFCKYSEAHISPVHQNSKHKVKKILTLDSNSQYCGALCGESPVGPYLIRRKENEFRGELYGKSTLAIHWLNWQSRKYHSPIAHMGNTGEGVIFVKGRQYRADGIMDNQKWKTLFFYDGCTTHGHTKCGRTGDEISPISRKTYAEMLKETKMRNKNLTSAGYKIVVKNSCDFKTDIKNNRKLANFIKHSSLELPSKKTRMCESQVIKKIKQGKLFGFALVNVEVDKHSPKYDTIKQFPPIIRKLRVNREMLAPKLQKIALKRKILTRPKECLVGCMSGKNILFYTPVLKYIINKLDVKITKVHQVIEFAGGQKPFESFGKFVANGRRMGDKQNSSIITNVYKTFGSTCYGMFAYRADRARRIKIVPGDEAQKLIMSPRFISLTELTNDFVEIEMQQRKVKDCFPIQVAVATYELAKLNLLKFVYSFLFKYFDPKLFSILQTDTDSATIAFAKENFEDAVKPHKKEDYEKQKYKFLVDDSSKSRYDYFKREPLKFKVEQEGTCFVGLSSKCYFIGKGKTKSEQETVKVATKGVQKERNKSLLNKKSFLKALETHEGVEIENISFRTRPGQKHKDPHMYTAKVKKIGLQPFDSKRKYLPPDYVFSEPHDETLEY